VENYNIHSCVLMNILLLEMDNSKYLWPFIITVKFHSVGVLSENTLTVLYSGVWKYHVRLVWPGTQHWLQKIHLASSDWLRSVSCLNASTITTHHAYHPAEYKFAVKSVFEKLKQAVRKNQMAMLSSFGKISNCCDVTCQCLRRLDGLSL
jgi:hypothetical protein